MSITKQRPGLASSHDLLAAAEALLPEIRAAADEGGRQRAASPTGWRSG